MTRICVNRSIASSLKTFFDDNGIDLEVVSDSFDSVSDVMVEDTGDQKRQSDMRIIYKGGSITCSTAQALADKLEISLAQTGAMLDHLDVKIKQCQLGCF